MQHQLGGVADDADTAADGAVGLGTENADNGDLLRGLQLAAQIQLILGHILPLAVYFLIVVGGGQDLEVQADEIIVAVFVDGGVDLHVLALKLLLQSLLQDGNVQKTQGVKGVVRDAVVLVHDHDHLVPGVGQAAVDDLILLLQQIGVAAELAPYIHTGGGAAHAGTHRAAALVHAHTHGGEHTAGIDLVNTVCEVGLVNVQGSGVNVTDLAGQVLQSAAGLNEMLEGGQVVGGGAGEHHVHHVGHDIGGVNVILFGIHHLLGIVHGIHHAAHIHGLTLQGQGVAGQGIPFNVFDKIIDAGGKAQNQSDTHDADGAGKGGENGPAFLGHQVA